MIDKIESCLDKIAQGRALLQQIQRLDEEAGAEAEAIINGLDALDLFVSIDEESSPNDGYSVAVKLKQKSTGKVLVERKGRYWVEQLCLTIRDELRVREMMAE